MERRTAGSSSVSARIGSSIRPDRPGRNCRALLGDAPKCFTYARKKLLYSLKPAMAQALVTG